MRLVVLAATLVLCQAADKLPVPSPADQKKSEKTIRDLLKDAYARKDQNSRRTLAKTLIEAGEKEADKTLAFTFFKEASDLAGEGMEFDLAMGAIERLEQHYKVEPESPLTGGTFASLYELRKALLKRTQKMAQSADDAMSYVKAATKLADVYFAADSFDDGLAVSQFAEGVAKASGDAGLLAVAKSYVRKYGDLKREHDKVSKAHLKILADPNDPEACETWGQFLVFVKGDWERGLGFLAKGKGGGLKALAEQEARKAPEVELADGWLALAEKAKEPDKGRYRSRARFWLDKAVASAAGVEKLKVEQKIKALDDALGIVDLLRTVDPVRHYSAKGNGKGGSAKVDGPKLVVSGAAYLTGFIEFPIVPPPEYDLVIVAKHKGGEGRCLLAGLSNGDRQWVVSLGTPFGPGPGIFSVDGKLVELDDAAKKAQAIGLTSGTFVFSVRKTGFKASVNGNEIIDWSGDSKRLTVPESMTVAHKNTLFLGTPSCVYEIEKAVLTPITGQAQRLR
jgi:hypothetical protein